MSRIPNGEWLDEALVVSQSNYRDFADKELDFIINYDIKHRMGNK